jgi:multidrug transporter EmrE-like cation transporter
MSQIFYLIILSIVEIIGDFALEKYANTQLLSALSLGILGYIGVVYFLIKCLAGSTILYVNGMWDGISSLVESLAAFIILGERFEDPMQYLGLFLITVGLLFLKKKPTKEVK